jgi:hypothetical protein
VVAVQVVEDERLMLLQQQQRNTSTTGSAGVIRYHDESREETLSLLGHPDSEERTTTSTRYAPVERRIEVLEKYMLAEVHRYHHYFGLRLLAR